MTIEINADVLAQPHESFWMDEYPEGDNICSSVGGVVGVSANISEDDRTGQCFVNVYSEFTCSAACYRGNDDY